MAAAGSEQKDLLALIHQHLVQTGYGKAARELLLQSGQKKFPPSPVLLKDIFTHWKRTSLQTQKQIADDLKRDTPAKIRVPDPKSSSESEEEEEVAKPIATNLSVNNRSTANAESSSEDEDSSSEEEAVAGKMVKTPVAGNKTNFLQLAAQKSNSVPGKGVAIAAVQARSNPSKAVSKPLPAVSKEKQQNKVLSGKPGPLIPAGQSPAQAAGAKKVSSSETSSSSSESEEEKMVTKPPAPTRALKKAESSSEDSSDDSEEEATNTAAVQVKPAVHSALISTMSAESSLATAVPSKAFPAQATPDQTRIRFGNTAGREKPAESSETSDSSDSEDGKPTSVVQAKLLGRTPQAFTSPVKTAPSALLSKKVVHTPVPLKQAAKASGTGLRKPGLLTPKKTAGSAKETESSEEESSSSSESKSEASPVPISQKGRGEQPPCRPHQQDLSARDSQQGCRDSLAPTVSLVGEACKEAAHLGPFEEKTEVSSVKRLQTPRPPAAAKQSLADKPGPPGKAASSALKGKESKSSSSSDSEDETFPATPNLPPPSATKTNVTAVLAGAKKLQPPSAPLQKLQESEDSSEDSSDESGSEEDTVFTQKPTQVTPKPGVVVPAKTPAAAKAAGAKASNVQPAGKGTPSSAKLAAASLQKEPESSETDSSDSSESEEDGKQAKQQTPSGNAAIPSGKGLQTDSVSSKCQGRGPAVIPGKVELSLFQKAKLGQSQAQLAKHAGILKGKESSGSSSSSDSEEEVAAAAATLTAAKQIAQPAGMLQKQGTIKTAESSSEESSDEDQEPSQSLLTGYPGLSRPPTRAVPKSTVSTLSKQAPGKAAPAPATPVLGAFAKSSEKAPLCDSSSSDSSDSDTDAEKTPARPKPEIGSLPSSVVAKRAVGAEMGPGSIGSQASSTKKARKTQSNGKAKGAAAKHKQMPPPLLSVAHPEGVGSRNEEAATRVSGAGAQGDTQATPHVAAEAPKTPKAPKAGVKEKSLKKRKATPGDAGLGEPKAKKPKAQSGLEVLKKKKKPKSSSSTKTPGKKEGKEKKSSKKKKKSKEVGSVALVASQKKKKKKKKTGDLEGAA